MTSFLCPRRHVFAVRKRTRGAGIGYAVRLYWSLSMHISLRMLACALLCAIAANAWSQATSAVSGQWTPMTEQNARALQEADAAFKTAVEADYQQRVADAKDSHPDRRGDAGGGVVSSSNQNTPLPSGMQGVTEPRGHARVPDPPQATSLEKLLPAALDFAAPTNGGLIVQRMSGSVLFGRSDSEEMVILPLGSESDLPRGMRGEIREEGEQLRLKVQLASGQVVEYRYHADPAALVVDISILGALPGKNVELQRSYRRAQVNVGELKKP